ncbi:MAG: alpha-amylase/4-alpha-glucanotransferase domain-containing protein [Dethiobacteria bacterium]
MNKSNLSIINEYTVGYQESLPENQTVYFTLALHNHQPVGNLPEVFSHAFKEAYAPFLELLFNYSSIKVVLHYSGILLEWIEKNEPSFFLKLGEMVERGQVEMMGGGFYEPILPIIPDSDKKGQVQKLSLYLQEKFGAEVNGIWLTERIWEPHLALPLCQAGIRYAVVDDANFHELGFKDEQLIGHYLTEEEGCQLNIFPISEKLRYLIPFEDPQNTIDHLRKILTYGSHPLAVLADDGEKFGVWPGTASHVYQEGWLEDFFRLLLDNSSWLQTTTFKEYLDTFPPRGRVYLPTSAYREMKEWSGGFWRNFLVRYPESNLMHKKMLAVNRRLPQVLNKDALNRAKNFVWAAQCNCAYWHGIFGGLYLNFLRSAIYENLIKAENIILQEIHTNDKWLEIKIEDRDYDGYQEIVLNNEFYSLLFSPNKGGSLWELSYRPAAVNLMDTLTRRPEAYHEDLFNAKVISENGETKVKTIHERFVAKEDDLQDYLLYDTYQRGSLLDHILEKDVNLHEFSRGRFREGNFSHKPYRAVIKNLPDCPKIIFSREAAIGENGSVTLFLQKKVSLKTASRVLSIDYKLKNKGEENAVFRFGIEFNLAFLAGYAPDRYYSIPGRQLKETHLASTGEEEGVQELYLCDEWRRVMVYLRFSNPAHLWRFPIETVSQSEAGLERVYQQSVVFPNWELNLKPQEKYKLRLELTVTSL